MAPVSSSGPALAPAAAAVAPVDPAANEPTFPLPDLHALRARISALDAQIDERVARLRLRHATGEDVP